MSAIINLCIKVECEKCGESLGATFFPSFNTLEVKICKNCFNKEKDYSYKDGYEEGREETMNEMKDKES